MLEIWWNPSLQLQLTLFLHLFMVLSHTSIWFTIITLATIIMVSCLPLTLLRLPLLPMTNYIFKVASTTTTTTTLVAHWSCLRWASMVMLPKMRFWISVVVAHPQRRNRRHPIEGMYPIPEVWTNVRLFLSGPPNGYLMFIPNVSQCFFLWYPPDVELSLSLPLTYALLLVVYMFHVLRHMCTIRYIVEPNRMRAWSPIWLPMSASSRHTHIYKHLRLERGNCGC